MFQRKRRARPVKCINEYILKIRTVKSRAEIEVMRKAFQIADKALTIVLNEFKVGLTEKEVANRIEYEMRHLGAQRPSFPSIVASGKNGFNAHHIPSEKKIASGEFLTIDLGSKFMNYCSDMTRTYFVGKPSEKQRHVYESVLESQVKAIEAVSVGEKLSEISLIARRRLKEKGFLRDFVHGLGHGVGIDIHEEPRVTIYSKESVRNGHVFTVEPGVYIKGWGGVRIEDTVAVFDNKVDTLSSAPKSVDEVIIS